MGSLYSILGQSRQAINFYQQSLSVSRKVNKDSKVERHRKHEASCLKALGRLYYSQGQYQQALDFYQMSLAIYEEISYPEGAVSSMNGLGDVYCSLGQGQRALDCYQKCLALEITSDAKSDALNSSNTKFTVITIPDIAIVAPKIGAIEFIRGNWQDAINAYQQAIESIEFLRIGSPSDNRRQQVMTNAMEIYANTVQCYVNLQQYDRALEYAERSRCKQLVDFIASKDLFKTATSPKPSKSYSKNTNGSNGK